MSATGLLPRGAVELVEHFNAQCDRTLQRQLRASADELEGARPLAARAPDRTKPVCDASDRAAPGMRLNARLAFAVRTRLAMNAPHIRTWHSALGLQARAPTTRSYPSAPRCTALSTRALGERGSRPCRPMCRTRWRSARS